MFLVDKQMAVASLRRARLLNFAERIHFCANWIGSRASNSAFAREHPEFVPPPAWLLYDASGGVNYRGYHRSGQASAAAIEKLTAPHLSRRSGIRILEWGCGPARIVRHIPGAFAEFGPKVYATDYNPKTIAWCEGAIRNVDFKRNDLNPPLPFDPASFDLIYSVSVFTHLSEDSHYRWLAELRRILAPRGILMMTAQGDRFREKLLPEEKSRYDSGQLVVRGWVKEGSRMYSAFHSPSFMSSFLGGSNIVLHDPNPDGAISGGQDVWISR